jgi:hypothetical protein
MSTITDKGLPEINKIVGFALSSPMIPKNATEMKEDSYATN